MSLHEYLILLRKGIEKLEDYGYAESIDVREEIRAGTQAIIRVKIVLVDGSVLHCNEFIDARYKIERLRYAFQYQNYKGELIFRYDNAGHKPPLTFKEHKHTSTGNIIQASLPDIFDLIDEVIEYL